MHQQLGLEVYDLSKVVQQEQISAPDSMVGMSSAIKSYTISYSCIQTSALDVVQQAATEHHHSALTVHK